MAVDNRETETTKRQDVTVQQKQKTANPGGSTVKFEPSIVFDDVHIDGIPMEIPTKSQCIAVMDHYQSKSIEEIRLEDYELGRRAGLSVSPIQIYSSGNKYGVFSSDDEDDDKSNGMAEKVINVIPPQPPMSLITAQHHPNTHEIPNAPSFHIRPLAPSTIQLTSREIWILICHQIKNLLD